VNEPKWGTQRKKKEKAVQVKQAIFSLIFVSDVWEKEKKKKVRDY